LSSSCDAEVEWLRQRAETVEVIMPDVQPEVGVEETVGSTRKRPRNAATIDICEEDENDQQDEHIDQPVQAESPRANEEGSESGGGEAAGDADQFHLDEDLLL
jgi:hypothetical protein